MRKTKLIIATLAISMLLSSTALAGTWTHTHETEWGINTYDDLWFYVKDSGEYAENEWIQDEDGTWYWIDDRKYATEELYNQLQEGMTYDQVISILGKEHEITNAERRQIGSQTYDYLQVRWYSQDAESKIRITFKNGLLHARHGDWQY